MADSPWVHIAQTGRGLDGGRWVFTWQVEEMAGKPMLITWLEAEHADFRLARQQFGNRKTPTRVQVTVDLPNMTDHILSDIELRLGVVWEGEAGLRPT